MNSDAPVMKETIKDLLERAFFLGQQSVQEEIHRLASSIGDWSNDQELGDLVRCSYHYWKQQNDECEELIIRFFNGAPERSRSPYRVLAAIILYKARFRLLRYQDGLEMLDAVITQYQDVTTREHMALMWCKGNVLVAIRRFNEAIACLRIAEACASKEGVQSVRALIQVDIAAVVLETGDYAKAIMMYEASLSVLSGDPQNELFCIMIRFNIASAYPHLRRDDEALAEYKQLLTYKAVVNESRYNLPVRLNMAISLKQLNRFEESMNEYLIVLDVARESANVEFQLRAHLGLVDLNHKLHDLKSARENAERAIELAEILDRDALRHQASASMAGIEYAEGHRSAGIDRLEVDFDWMVNNAHSLHALEYGGMLINWCTEESLFERAYRYHTVCAQIRSTMYANEVERTVELTSVRSRLDHEHESIRTRDQERNRILNAVLPPHIADRLMRGEKYIADEIPEVTIMFADIVGFTTMASKMEPHDVVQLLERLFSALDEVCLAHRCERLKTIGDSYMAICGVSPPYPDHVARMCRAALAIVKSNGVLPLDQSQLRIGIHTGPVIAGVMNGTRLSYDLWGDTVNVAAKMEGHSSPGKILCSQQVKDVLHVNNIASFEKTKPLDIKGKGLIDTYWLTSTFVYEVE